MSMTSLDYKNWCNAVSNTNLAMRELWDTRKENYSWMREHLKEFFSSIGQVNKIDISGDASVISIQMNGAVDMNAEAFSTLPFNFEVKVSDSNDITFWLYPDVEAQIK